MLPHSRFWLFVLTVVLFLLLATALCGAATRDCMVASVASTVAPAAPSAVPPADAQLGNKEATVLAAKLLLHLVAVAFGLRVGMKIFYESAMWGGFVAIVLIDTVVAGAMSLSASFFGDVFAMLGPQVVVTGLVMIITLHHFGFTKDRFTVIPAVLVAKAFGFFAEVALRMLFLDAILRSAAARGL